MDDAFAEDLEEESAPAVSLLAKRGLTRERVRQIQLDALKNLKSMMEENGISGDAILD